MVVVVVRGMEEEEEEEEGSGGKGDLPLFGLSQDPVNCEDKIRGVSPSFVSNSRYTPLLSSRRPRSCGGIGSGVVPRLMPSAAQNDRLGVENEQNTTPPACVVMLVNACSGSDHPKTLTSGSRLCTMATNSAVSLGVPAAQRWLQANQIR